MITPPFQFRAQGRALYPQKHILVCEDNLENQRKIVAHLSGLFPAEGLVQVSVVSGALAASSVLSYCKIDLVILDHDMPEGNGIDLLTWMRGTRYPIADQVVTFSDNRDDILAMAAFGLRYPYSRQQVLDGYADEIIKHILGYNDIRDRKTRPKVTVLLTSGRPGGIDIALSGLSDQTYTDFEVVFVDGLYHRRHTQVLDYVAKIGFNKPFYHVPHHRSPDNDIWGVPCAGYNTGFMLADGEIVIMLMDYAFAPPGWIESHLRHHLGARRLVMSAHEYRFLPEMRTRDGHTPRQFAYEDTSNTPIEAVIQQRTLFDDITIFRKPFDMEALNSVAPYPPELNDQKLAIESGPSTWGLMHTKNDSFPLDAILDINGIDEFYDRGRGPGDSDLGRRLAQHGLECWFSAESRVFCLNPRPVLPNAAVAIPRERRLPPPWDHRFCYDEGETYFQRCRALKTPLAFNPYSLRERREKIWHWREQSQQRDPVIPDNRVPDNVYFSDV